MEEVRFRHWRVRSATVGTFQNLHHLQKREPVSEEDVERVSPMRQSLNERVLGIGGQSLENELAVVSNP
ncbi:unnamed protein product [Linum trigynum]|uniref:Uncharacterized protein n=1 Tax=Linum trigynum TaxID=586398 RepID=A0AAV2E1B2_9ROSI